MRASQIQSCTWHLLCQPASRAKCLRTRDMFGLREMMMRPCPFTRPCKTFVSCRGASTNGHAHDYVVVAACTPKAHSSCSRPFCFPWVKVSRRSRTFQRSKQHISYSHSLFICYCGCWSQVLIERPGYSHQELWDLPSIAERSFSHY